MAFPTTGILDNFNRANEGPPPSASWTDISSGLKVVSNEVAGNSVGSNITYWNVGTFGPDCEAYWTFDYVTYQGVMARLKDVGSSSTYDGYTVWVSGSNTISISRIDNGSLTQLGATISQTCATGDKIGIECVGTTISAYFDDGGAGWGSIGNRTDSTYQAAGYIAGYISGTTQTNDDFGGGTVSGAQQFDVALTLTEILAVSLAGTAQGSGTGSWGLSLAIAEQAASQAAAGASLTLAQALSAAAMGQGVAAVALALQNTFSGQAGSQADAALAMDLLAALSPASTSQALADLSLNGVFSVTIAGNLLISVALALAENLSLSAQATSQANAGASLALGQALSSVAAGQSAAAVALALQNVFNGQASSQALAAFGLNENLSLSAQATSQAEAGANLTLAQALSAAATGQGVAAVALALQNIFSGQAGSQAEAALTMDLLEALIPAGTSQALAAFNLNETLGIEIDIIAEVLVSVALTLASSLNLAIQAMAQTSGRVTLDIFEDMVLVIYVIPSERIFVVTVENRSHDISSESRTFVVPAEGRDSEIT